MYTDDPIPFGDRAEAIASIGADQYLPGPDRTADRPWMASHTPIGAS